MGNIYLLGDQTCLTMKRIAVVGTRAMSVYGERMARAFVDKLVKKEWCIVSGLARGIDRVAHEETLRQKGKTIAVLGHGLNQCYPREHEDLKKQILERGGLLVSEYEDDVTPTPDKFRARDRLMAHLSQAILVVESPRRSGVKITVSGAADEGINVYVIPGPIDQPSYHGSVEISRNGGIPVYSPDDLMEQLKFV